MEIYKDNIKKYTVRIAALKQVLRKLSFIRLTVFVTSIAIIILLFNLKLTILGFIFIPVTILCFGFILKRHDKTAYQIQHTKFLKHINASEILRENCDLNGFNAGAQFSDPNHPYASDLDVFGEHSIFQLLNRTTTESGEIRLSEWLTKPATNTEIFNRQEAIKELALKLDWRQNFQASGLHFQNKKSDYLKLLDWVKQPVVLIKKQYLYIAIASILPILFFVSVYFFYVNLGASRWFMYLLFMISILAINYFILKQMKFIAEDIVFTSTNNLSTLKGYQALLIHIESVTLKSKKLHELQAILLQEKYSASNEINKICRLLEFSHQRPIKKIPIGGNYMYPLLNSVFLLDIYLILGTEKWKLKNNTFLKSWANIVSEFEVVNSFAGFTYSNPSYNFPELTDQHNYIHFKSLGHPLLHPDSRICNDFHSEGHGQVVMITGSNMGGKSTFLRTVGVNLVLALAGAPCCAKHAKVANMNIFTSMRTQDNLMKGVSSFYAELNRIEHMLTCIDKSENVFFLLDEMFKGTNSEDRQRGGYSLINQISKLKTSGIIATHDIELAKLSGQKNLVTNYSFNSKIEDNTMVFSYKLDPFICTDFNASELMKKSGIKILSDITDELNT
ncbi:DNA mismatch repair protein MutS [Formosa agariphila KMM 3901]|uniref:DNA mismatch repair protein MutS n=1 Tax=Formosa agariphila (strain DSM 15362 / KCTC 12365 / LMG 23005 / KMM 3901 / M-2Alg 35-1) TaxID=1347342 RepID=T2KKX5_FORAG|nr:DNA mismatch repair protein MutS [Formosa agariphila]CDF79091.1 DNA mismatch repair protein MutS [Formosa agariphila KMM 3901]